MYGEGIEMGFPWSDSWPFQRVSKYFFHCTNKSLILGKYTADREHDDSKEFREFRRTIFHASLSHILQTLKEGMSEPVLLRYADGYYWWTIYGLGPYIADYPEQVLLACVVQDWCPK